MNGKLADARNIIHGGWLGADEAHMACCLFSDETVGRAREAVFHGKWGYAGEIHEDLWNDQWPMACPESNHDIGVGLRLGFPPRNRKFEIRDLKLQASAF